jgi:hypothetical protein
MQEALDPAAEFLILSPILLGSLLPLGSEAVELTTLDDRTFPLQFLHSFLHRCSEGLCGEPGHDFLAAEVPEVVHEANEVLKDLMDITTTPTANSIFAKPAICHAVDSGTKSVYNKLT